jgi:hypothetical protein
VLGAVLRIKIRERFIQARRYLAETAKKLPAQVPRYLICPVNPKVLILPAAAISFSLVPSNLAYLPIGFFYVLSRILEKPSYWAKEKIASIHHSFAKSAFESAIKDFIEPDQLSWLRQMFDGPKYSAVKFNSDCPERAFDGLKALTPNYYKDLLTHLEFLANKLSEDYSLPAGLQEQVTYFQSSLLKSNIQVAEKLKQLLESASQTPVSIQRGDHAPSSQEIALQMAASQGGIVCWPNPSKPSAEEMLTKIEQIYGDLISIESRLNAILNMHRPGSQPK